MDAIEKAGRRITELVGKMQKVPHYETKKYAEDTLIVDFDPATRDGLTGLFNRRYFWGILEQEIARALRYKSDLVLCMMDLDHFKQINDTHGHPAGDMVLSETGKMIKGCIRRNELVCRYGGEEFAVILPETQPEGAWAVCERLREMTADYHFKFDSSQFRITISIGFASYRPSHKEEPSDLIARADKALYQAKKGGRNRVIMFEDRF